MAMYQEMLHSFRIAYHSSKSDDKYKKGNQRRVIVRMLVAVWDDKMEILGKLAP
jgi:hypothetical protein